MNSVESQKLVQVDHDLEHVVFEGRKLPLYEMLGDKTPHYYFLAALPVNRIERDEEAQPREYVELQAKKIADSIRRKVLMQPILTRYDAKSDKFFVTEGQHRWRAVKDFLKHDRIPCIVYTELEKELALLCGLEANAEDRAKALSAGDRARKYQALMAEYRQLVAEETGKPEVSISESAVLERMGHISKSDQSKFLLGSILQDLNDYEGGKIKNYLSIKQAKDRPLTYNTFGRFVSKFINLRAIEEGDENLRDDEFVNLVRLTNIFAEVLFDDGKWNPDETDSLDTRHAINICRWHPVESCGYFIAKAIAECGGRDNALGTLYVPSTSIDWATAEGKIKKILGHQVWDYEHIWPLRNVEKLIEKIDSVWRKENAEAKN